MFYWILAFTATFLFNINNVYIANIVFFIWIIAKIFIKKSSYSIDQRGLYIYFFYLIWILFSMLIFILQYGYFEFRNIVQFLYNIQYIILITYGFIDKCRLRKAMHVCSYLLAFMIIGLWITTTDMMSIPTLIVHYREWAEGIIGGWPNTTVLPLTFGVYMEMKAIMRDRKILGLARLGLLLFAILLCTSRTGYVGVALVIGYFLFTEKEGTKRRWKFLKHVISIGLVAVVAISVISFITINEMENRMFMVADRMDIFRDMLFYIRNRPIIGYGGNSVDVIYKTVGKTRTGINWGHTHNTVLELLIRHGIVGMIVFAMFVFRASKRIIQKEDKVMYWILWALSVLQIFYKDFVFLLILYMLIPSKNEQSDFLADDLKLTNTGGS